METKERKQIVETWQGTFEGVPCTVAGWRNPDYAGLTSDFPYNWGIRWQTLARIMRGDERDIKATDVWLSRRLWLGVGVDFPEAIKARFLL